MNLLNAINSGLRQVWAHKFRSVLTMLGIALGSRNGVHFVLRGFVGVWPATLEMNFKEL
jgi:hypothetical protein